MVLLGACDRGAERSGGAGGAKSITVVIAEYSKDHTKSFWQGLSDQYTKQAGVKVDLRIVDWNSIDQQVSTMIQNNQPPDVLTLNSFSSSAKDQLLHSADEVLSPKPRGAFIESFARGGEYQGKLYGFPILSSARAFFYNKDLFARAGLAGPPKTWDDFVQAARKIQGLGGGVIGYALPLGPEEAQAEWAIWMWNNGGARRPGGHAWRRGLPDGVQETRQPGRREAVPRSLLPAGEHHAMDHGRGLPARDQVRPLADELEREAEALSGRVAQCQARADDRSGVGPGEARRPA